MMTKAPEAYGGAGKGRERPGEAPLGVARPDAAATSTVTLVMARPIEKHSARVAERHLRELKARQP